MPLPLAVPLALGAIRVGAAVLARSRAVSAAKVAVNVATKTKAGGTVKTVANKTIKNPSVKTVSVSAKAAKTGKAATAAVTTAQAARVLGFAKTAQTASKVGLAAVGTGAAGAWYLTNKKRKTSKNGGSGSGGSGGSGSNKGRNKGSDAASGTKPSSEILTPKDYKFNLPPHNWSLPTRPHEVAPGSLATRNAPLQHGLRRGRLWHWGTAGVIDSYNYESGTVEKGKNKNSSTYTGTDPKLTHDENMYKYGFQFLWNPASISINVNRTEAVIPQVGDVYASVRGTFPGQESITFSVIIDRTNDMACIRSQSPDGPQSWDSFSNFYTSGKWPSALPQPVGEQIKELSEIGTMHDIEYLLKSVNGDGTSITGTANGWTNLLGKKTADIGFLQTSLVAFEFGGDPYDSKNQSALSYVGWISQLTLNHTAFTEGMVPIRSELTIAFDCFAGISFV